MTDLPDPAPGVPGLEDGVDPALASAVLEVEQHVATEGWDRPARLYALVETARLVAHEPALAAAMGLDESAAAGSLTPVEQEALRPDLPLEQQLEEIAWPDGVAGCAAVVERFVLPPGADEDLPEDAAAQAAYAAEHPDRQEVRMVAGATRHGATYCALRFRSHDEDTSVVGGVDLVPGLIDLVRATLTDDDPTDDRPTADRRPDRRTRVRVSRAPWTPAPPHLIPGG